MPEPPQVLTRDGLVAAGRGHDHGDRRVRTGAWSRAAPSTCVTGTLDLRGRVEAALAHAGREAVVTGWAACAALGLAYVVDGGAVPVLVPARRRRVSTPGVGVLPTTRAPSWWHWLEVRVAAPARAVVDAARALPDLRPVRALVLGAATTAGREQMCAELEAGATPRSALCRRALADLAAGARRRRRPTWPTTRQHWCAGDGCPRSCSARTCSCGVACSAVPTGGWSGSVAAGRSSRASALLVAVAEAEARGQSGATEPGGLVVVPRGPLLPLPAYPVAAGRPRRT